LNGVTHEEVAKSNEMNKTQVTSTGMTGVNEFVNTLAGSFIISGLSNKMELKRVDSLVKKALVAITNYTKSTGKGMIEVLSMPYEQKMKALAELPPVKLERDTNDTNVTDLKAGDEDEDITKVLDGDTAGDSAPVLIDLSQGNKGFSVRVNFAIRSIRVEANEWMLEAKASIQKLMVKPQASNVTGATQASNVTGVKHKVTLDACVAPVTLDACGLTINF
jgi:hypothetical protein